MLVVILMVKQTSIIWTNFLKFFQKGKSDMEIQDFRESSHSSYFKEWYGKVIQKGEEIRVSLTISKKCGNVELEKEKMLKILEELYLNQDEWNKKVKDTMVKYFYDVLNDDFFMMEYFQSIQLAMICYLKF